MIKIITVLQYDAKYVNINFPIKYWGCPSSATSHVNVNRLHVCVYYKYYYYYSNDLLKLILTYVHTIIGYVSKGTVIFQLNFPQTQSAGFV